MRISDGISDVCSSDLLSRECSSTALRACVPIGSELPSDFRLLPVLLWSGHRSIQGVCYLLVSFPASFVQCFLREHHVKQPVPARWLVIPVQFSSRRAYPLELSLAKH